MRRLRAHPKRSRISCVHWWIVGGSQSLSRLEILTCSSNFHGSVPISLRGEDIRFRSSRQRERCWGQAQSQGIYRSAFRDTQCSARASSEPFSANRSAARRSLTSQLFCKEFSVDDSDELAYIHNCPPKDSSLSARVSPTKKRPAQP